MYVLESSNFLISYIFLVSLLTIEEKQEVRREVVFIELETP